jgi:membrane associated rhomboid family serine protease
MGGFRFFPPVIRALLIINVAVWLLTDIILEILPFSLAGHPLGGAGGLLTQYLALWPFGEKFYVWQIGTYMFLHGGFTHIFFNMLALWMFGMELENTWGSRKFLIYYCACGLGAGIANLLVASLMGQLAPTVGASGAVFGILIAFGMLFPDRPIYVYFLLPVRAKYFVAIYILIELVYGVAGTSDGVAHFAHLGGAAVGLIFLLIDRSGVTLPSFGKSQHRGRVFSNLGRFGRNADDVQDAKFYDIKTGQQKGPKDITQDDIDAILDKISAGGYQSLTEEEKRVLFDASKKLH